MRQYEDMPADPEPDPRIVMVQRVVDLEQQCYATQREAEQMQKRAAVVRGELDDARRELFTLLGVGDDAKKQVAYRD
jgi:hypothetical protein